MSDPCTVRLLMMVLAIAGSTPMACFCAAEVSAPVEQAPESCCTTADHRGKQKERQPQPCHSDPVHPGNESPRCCCTIGHAPVGPLPVEQGAVLLDGPAPVETLLPCLWSTPSEGVPSQRSFATRDRPRTDPGTPLFDQHCLLLV